MGFFTSGRRQIVVSETQKWDYINLNDFRSKSCGNITGYLWVWIMAIISCAVYIVDTFTAVKLLAFNQWSSQIKPTIPFEVSKWIFAGCIILSWSICLYEWVRAYNVMKWRSVTEDYLDPLAVILQSIRWNGGYKRFLVFAKLTKSKKKATWFALFVYFERKGALRVLAAEGPRQVVNALTLWSVMQASIIPTGEHAAKKGSSPIAQFFVNIKTLADENMTQAVILSSMAFTLFIWVISMILLILALIFYVFFLWGYIKNETLTGFCRRKIETKLAKIVKAKTDKIWRRQREKDAELLGKGAKSNDEFAFSRKPTLPVFDDDDDSFAKPTAPSIMSGDSDMSLPQYTSQPTTPANEYPTRNPSVASFSTYTTQNTSLLGSAAPMGSSNPPYSRPGTSHSSRSYSTMRSGVPTIPPLRTNTGGPMFPPPSARASPMSASSGPTPLSGMSAPWRTPVSAINEDEYELQEASSGAMPSALRPAMGRREFSSPASAGGPMSSATPDPMPLPPARSFTAPMAPGAAGFGHAPPLPRSMTPGVGPARSMTPAGMTRSPPRSHTPGSLQAGRPRPPDPELGPW